MIRLDAYRLSAEILKLVAEIDEFKGRWESLGRISPESLSHLRMVATIESVGSSTRIEGARLSDVQVKTLLSRLDARSFQTRDEEEVAGYADAMTTVFDSWAHIPLDENHIRQLHGILLKYSGKDSSHRGEYKKLPNTVEAFDEQGRSLGVVFETASPFETPTLMRELVAAADRGFSEGKLHPLLVIAAFTIHFLAIHPFHDGNGRLSRILMTLMLLRKGYLYVPYRSMEAIVEENKAGYYRALRSSQQDIRTEREDLGEWVSFFLRTLKAQKDTLLARMEREGVAEKIPPLSERILSIVRERGRLTVAEAVALTGANRNTLKAHLARLVDSGRLQRNGRGKGTWYSVGRG